MLFRDAIKKVFEVFVPYFGHLGEETFSDCLITHIHEDFAKEEVVLGDIGVLRAPFSCLKIDLNPKSNTAFLS